MISDLWNIFLCNRKLSDLVKKKSSFKSVFINWIIAAAIYILGIYITGDIGINSPEIASMGPIVSLFFLLAPFLGIALLIAILIIISSVISGFGALAVGGTKKSVLVYGLHLLNISASVVFISGITFIILMFIAFLGIFPGIVYLSGIIKFFFNIYGIYLRVELTKHYFSFGWAKSILSAIIFPIISMFIILVIAVAVIGLFVDLHPQLPPGFYNS